MIKPVAVILLNWNTPVHTTACIISLKQYCDNRLFDIIVVDNGSADDSVSILKSKFQDIVYIENGENLGFAEGNNKGLAYSLKKGYTYSLVMNTDTLVDSDLVSGLATHLDKYENAAVVQPAIYWMHNPNSIWNGKGSFNPVLGVTKTDNTLPQKDKLTYQLAEWVTGCCMLIRNEALVKNGLFNKHFFLYYEDSEFSFRLRELGYELHYLPSSKMYHEAGVSAKVEKKEGFLSPIIHYYISRNHIWFLRRFGKPIWYPINFTWNGCYYLSLWIYLKLRHRNEKARFLIKGLKEGLFTPAKNIWP